MIKKIIIFTVILGIIIVGFSFNYVKNDFIYRSNPTPTITPTIFITPTPKRMRPPDIIPYPTPRFSEYHA